MSQNQLSEEYLTKLEGFLQQDKSERVDYVMEDEMEFLISQARVLLKARDAWKRKNYHQSQINRIKSYPGKPNPGMVEDLYEHGDKLAIAETELVSTLRS